jgi:hypothetical protein
MKKILIGLIMWFIACAVIGIAWHQAFGYTFEGALDPQTFNSWEIVPECSQPPVFMMLKNPDPKSDIPLAIVILQPIVFSMPTGPVQVIMIVAYCYFQKGELHFYKLENDCYVADKDITAEIRADLLQIFLKALKVKQAGGAPWPSINADYVMRLSVARMAMVSATA